MKYILLILIASLFHGSSIVLLPLIFLSYNNGRFKFIYIVIAWILFLLPFIFIKDINTSITIFTNTYFPDYGSYTKDTDLKIDIGWGFAFNVFVYLLITWFAQKELIPENKIILKIAIISFLLIPLGLSFYMLGRISFYLLPVMMAVFPIVFIRIKKIELKYIFTLLIVVFTFVQYYQFFHSGWEIHFGEYHTILSAPKIY
jgi:transmembrane protein EpsG